MSGNASLVSEWNSELAAILIPNDVILSVYLMFGILGNSSVILVYIFRIRKQTDNRFFVPILAASDLFACLICASFGLILNMLQAEFTNTALCKTFWFFASGATFNSILLLTIIAVHRYLKVCRPYGKQMTLRWKRVAIGVGFCISLSLAIPTPFLYGIVEFPNSDSDIVGLRCSKLKDVNNVGSLIYSGIVLLIILASLTTLIVLYSRIGRKVHKHVKFMSIRKSVMREETSMTSVTRNSEVFTEDERDQEVHRCCWPTRKGPKAKSENPKINDHASSATVTMPKSLIHDRIAKIKENENLSATTDIKSRQQRKRHSSSDTLRSSTSTLDSMRGSHNKPKIKFAVIFMIITIVFLLCYIPKTILLILEGLDPTFWEKFSDTERAGVLFVYRMYILGNVCNPFIYGFIDTKFRKELKTCSNAQKQKHAKHKNDIK